MEIQQARIVAALVKAGSMMGAAEELGITQPAISTALGKLEKQLGVVIFHRSRKGLQLTHQGKLLLPGIGRLLDAENEILQKFTVQSESSGSLHVSGRQSFMEDIFPILLAAL